MKYVLRLAFILSMILTALICLADSFIRVGILRAHPSDSIKIASPSGLILIGLSSGRRTIGNSATVSVQNGRILLQSENASPRLVPSARIASGAGIVSVNALAYRGNLTFTCRRGRLMIVNEVHLEDYVRGIVANEMRHEWPLEALKAQAVIARTLAAQRIHAHASEGFDICDTTHCQVYRGIRTETPATNRAVRSTAGSILTWQGSPIQALYCSCCGGVSASSFASHTLGHAPYLTCQKDTLNMKFACQDSPHFNWNYSVDAADLASALNSDPLTQPGSSLHNFRILSRDPSGRAKFFSIDGNRSREIDAYDCWNVICRQLGWGSLKSTRFRLSKMGRTYTFRGHGLGHGIGLCQWGARKRAEAGWSFSRILAFYYPGTKLAFARIKYFSTKP